MTDMIVHNPSNNGWGIHTADKKACSGFNTKTYPYQSLVLVLKEWVNRDIYDSWSTRCYHEYKRGYLPIMPVFLVRWSDDTN